MHEEGKYEVQIFGFFKSKSLNWEGLKIWDCYKTGLYLKKYKYLGKKKIDRMWFIVWAFEWWCLILDFQKFYMVFRWG